MAKKPEATPTSLPLASIFVDAATGLMIPIQAIKIAALKLMMAAGRVWDPITVRPTADGRYEVCDGRHRYECAVLLGHESIPVIILEMDDALFATTQSAANDPAWDSNIISHSHSCRTHVRFIAEHGLQAYCEMAGYVPDDISEASAKRRFACDGFAVQNVSASGRTDAQEFSEYTAAIIAGLAGVSVNVATDALRLLGRVDAGLLALTDVDGLPYDAALQYSTLAADVLVARKDDNSEATAKRITANAAAIKAVLTSTAKGEDKLIFTDNDRAALKPGKVVKAIANGARTNSVSVKATRKGDSTIPPKPDEGKGDEGSNDEGSNVTNITDADAALVHIIGLMDQYNISIDDIGAAIEIAAEATANAEAK